MKGRTVRALLCALICVSAVASAQQAMDSSSQRQVSEVDGKNAGHVAVTYDGARYELAFVDLKGKTATNEYVPEGESLSHWTTLIGVRRFGSATEIKDVLPTYVASVKPMLATPMEVLGRKGIGATQDVMVVLLLTSPDKSYYEYNLHRFIKTSEGVVAYQFAQRIPRVGGHADFTPIIARQAERIKELNDMNIAVQTTR